LIYCRSKDSRYSIFHHKQTDSRSSRNSGRHPSERWSLYQCWRCGWTRDLLSYWCIE